MISKTDEIERLCVKYPIVKQIWTEYETLFSDPSIEFANAITFAAREVANATKNKTLNIKEEYHASLMALLNDCEKMYKGINTSMGKTAVVEEEKAKPKSSMKYVS